VRYQAVIDCKRKNEIFWLFIYSLHFEVWYRRILVEPVPFFAGSFVESQSSDGPSYTLMSNFSHDVFFLELPVALHDLSERRSEAIGLGSPSVLALYFVLHAFR
jgi:hypothetical protein